VATPHDSFGKSLLSRPQEAASFLASVLPGPLASQLDLQTLALVPGSFVDDHLRWRFTDLLYEVELAGHEARVYVLAEMQSTVDPLMALRVLIYLGRIWDRWLREQESEGGGRPTRVPAIVPVVLYQGPEGWTAATEFLEIMDLPAGALEGARDYLPSFRFLLDDLSQESDEGVRERGMSPLATVGLLLLKHARDSMDGLFQVLAQAADLFNQLENEEDRVLAISYILELGEFDPQGLLQALGDRSGPEIKEAVMTAAEKLRKEGEVQGERRALLRQLRHRFASSLSPAIEDRVSRASEPELEVWLDRVLTATTLEEVFAEQGP
jgi:predicted transposase YdaD